MYKVELETVKTLNKISGYLSSMASVAVALKTSFANIYSLSEQIILIIRSTFIDQSDSDVHY
jgi:hypothetical protein